MTEQPCKHEVDLALMSKALLQNTADTAKILDILTGNGKPGLKTDVALSKSHIRRLYLWVGGLTMAIVAAALKLK